MPIVGGLFRHKELIQSNTELIIFITPYVVDTDSAPETIRQIEKSREKLGKIAQGMDELFGTDTFDWEQTSEIILPSAESRQDPKAKTEDE